MKQRLAIGIQLLPRRHLELSPDNDFGVVWVISQRFCAAANGPARIHSSRNSDIIRREDKFAFNLEYIDAGAPVSRADREQGYVCTAELYLGNK